MVPTVAVLMVAGLHAPVIPLVEVVGSAGAGEPLQIDAIALNVGVVLLLTVTVKVVFVAHCPAFAVKL